MSHRVLAISEIGLLVCEALDRRTLGRLARVSRFWRTVAEDVLWRDRLTGMQPLLASMPMGAYQWDLSRTIWGGRVMTGMDIYFHLSPDELRDVLKRSKFVRHINFDYRKCVVDLVIFTYRILFVVRCGRSNLTKIFVARSSSARVVLGRVSHVFVLRAVHITRICSGEMLGRRKVTITTS
ncbi:hypothetical protein EV715DRAFT_297738 [Schizophyllum commune]